jgi:alpha-N-acetyl-neuraminate alpha-2,8-sialyltransferase (sialyltransferase 8B)/alpha-N-acetyl-neuraminate alpha-2,8-sialyltransferase (sialyltransferase 8D)
LYFLLVMLQRWPTLLASIFVSYVGALQQQQREQQQNHLRPSALKDLDKYYEMAIKALPTSKDLDPATRARYQQELMCLFKEYVERDAISGVRIRSLEDYAGPSMPQVKGTCAVVGSSGVLLMHSYGTEIDEAAKVFRFNTAPVEGLEQYVGQKDNHRFVNEKVLDLWSQNVNVSMFSHNVTYTASCTLCKLGTDYRVTPDVYKRRVMATSFAHPNLQLYASDLTLESKVQDFIKRVYKLDDSPAGVTTGAIGMALALSLCDEVKAYGLAATPYDDVVPYHYWEPSSTIRTTEHHHGSILAEKDLWMRLATNPPEDVGDTGVAVLPGFSSLTCSTT